MPVVNFKVEFRAQKIEARVVSGGVGGLVHDLRSPKWSRNKLLLALGCFVYELEALLVFSTNGVVKSPSCQVANVKKETFCQVSPPMNLSAFQISRCAAAFSRASCAQARSAKPSSLPRTVRNIRPPDFLLFSAAVCLKGGRALSYCRGARFSMWKDKSAKQVTTPPPGNWRFIKVCPLYKPWSSVWIFSRLSTLLREQGCPHQVNWKI